MAVRNIPHWDDVADWAARQLTQARAELETSEINGDKNRGKIETLRALLEMPDQMTVQRDQKIERDSKVFRPDPLSYPPEYI